MLDFEEYRKLRNGKRYCTSTEHTMSDNDSIEKNLTATSSENFKGEVYEIQMLTREAVSEQIRAFIAPLARQLEELTRLVQGLVTTLHQDHCFKTDLLRLLVQPQIRPTLDGLTVVLRRILHS